MTYVTLPTPVFELYLGLGFLACCALIGLLANEIRYKWICMRQEQRVNSK